MTLRILRAIPESGLALVGFYVPLAVMGGVFFQLAAFDLLTRGFPPGSVPNQGQLNLNLALFAGFAVVGAAWSLLVALRRVSLGSGGGFVLAGTALFLRAVSEQTIALDFTAADDSSLDLLMLARGGGLLVYALGLGFVIGACVGEQVHRRQLSVGRPAG